MQTYSDSELYDIFANQADPADLLAQPIDEMAEHLCALIGVADSEGTRYPDDGDGMVDTYAIAHAIKRVAQRTLDSIAETGIAN